VSTISVVRFTYERFSDHFIASSLIASLKSTDLVNAFDVSGCFSPIIKSDSYFRYAGIIAALSIIIAEKHGVEIIDLLPNEIGDSDWLFDQVFTDTIQWRDPTSN